MWNNTFRARFISMTAELTVEWASDSRRYVTWQVEIVMIYSSPNPYLLSEISGDHFEKHHFRRRRGCRPEQSHIDANIIRRTRSTIGYVRGEVEKVVFIFMGRDQGWEENFGYASGHLIISMYSYGGQTPDASSWTWLGAEIWRPVPTSWESDPDCVTDPCQIDDVLSNKCHSHKAHLDPMNAATPVWKRKRYICSVWLCE